MKPSGPVQSDNIVPKSLKWDKYQNFVLKVRLVFQNEITDWTFVESLKITSKLKLFQTLDQSLPRNSF